MSRIPLVSVSEMTEEQHAQYARFPSNLTRALLLMDQRLAGALPNLANALRASSLEASLREAVILRVAALQGSAYERMQHLEQARKVGWNDEDIVAIEAGGESLSDPRLKAVLAFVDACVASSEVSDPAFAAASDVLSHRDLATVVVLVGHYMMVARFLGILQVQLDAQPDSWKGDH
jgi:alkylhydroperoxidase family enzyme